MVPTITAAMPFYFNSFRMHTSWGGGRPLEWRNKTLLTKTKWPWSNFSFIHFRPFSDSENVHRQKRINAIEAPMRKLCKKMKRNQRQLKKLWNQFAEKRLGANSMKNTCNHQLTSFFRGFLLLSFVINGSALSAAVPRVGYTQESNWPNSRPFRLRGWPLLARQFNAVSGFMRNESAMKALWCGKVGGDPALGLGGRHRRCIVVRSSYSANCTSPAKSSLDSMAGLACRAGSSNP